MLLCALLLSLPALAQDDAAATDEEAPAPEADGDEAPAADPEAPAPAAKTLSEALNEVGGVQVPADATAVDKALGPAMPPCSMDKPDCGDSVFGMPQPTGLVQVWLTAYDQDSDILADPAGYGDPEDDPGFKLRRARAGFEGETDTLSYGVVVGMSSPFDNVRGEGSEDIGLVDGYFGWKPYDAAHIVVGLQKVPVSREQLMSAGELPFTERSVATAWLAPERDVGISGAWDLATARVRLGVFNGNGSLLGDDNPGLLYAARLEWDNATGDELKGTYGTVDKLTLGTACSFHQSNDVATTTMGWGCDALVRMSGLSVMAEGRDVRIGPGDTTVDTPDVFVQTRRTGIMAQLGWTQGSLEFIGRYSMLDDDVDASDNGDVADVIGGVIWHGEGDNLRAGAGFVHRMEVGGLALDNDTARLWTQLKF